VTGAGEVTVREAHEADVPAIMEIYEQVYGSEYPYRSFYDEGWLKRSVYTDDIIMLVAVDAEDRPLGTASIVFDLGAHSDLLAEFGRLAVHPDARGLGIGNLLMAKRCEFAETWLHVGIAQNRCVHPFSQRISRSHGFAPLGLLPVKYRFQTRESAILWGRHFGPGLSLRRNHPRVVPEAFALASVCLEGCGLPPDAIVDETSPSYPHGGTYGIEELTAVGLPSLLRIERGRVHRREVFGPMRLQYGFFQLTAKHAHYLIARPPDSGTVAGAVGYIHDDISDTAHIFELIHTDEEVVRVLLDAFVDHCRDELGVVYMDVDVSAYAPRMQSTLLELGFLPAAYIPAMVFHHVERLDVVKMVKLLIDDIELGEVSLIPESQAVADLVLPAFLKQAVVPRIAEAIGEVELFAGLSSEQAQRVAGVCGVKDVVAGEVLFRATDPGERMYVPLDAAITIYVRDTEVGSVGRGEVVGEVAALTEEPHSATAVAAAPGTVAVLSHGDLRELQRQRPDIAMLLYRNLAVGLGRKLRRVDQTVATHEPARRRD
jgi:GNAT superfamily N-acetyltransferase